MKMEFCIGANQKMVPTIYMVMISILLINVCKGNAQLQSNEIHDGMISDNFALRNRDQLHLRHLHHRRQYEDEVSNTSSATADIQWPRYTNFLLTDYLADGEMERRINYNGSTAKETSISTTT